MRTTILGLMAVGLLAGPVVANANLVTYDFTWVGTVGPNAGTSSSGFMTFDDSLFENNAYLGSLVDFSFSWAGFSYDEIDVLVGLVGPVDALSITLIGTDCTVDNWMQFCGLSNVGDFTMWFAPFSTFEFQGAAARDQGNVSWTLRTVPEPGTLALLSLGLAGLGLSRKRKAA